MKWAIIDLCEAITKLFNLVVGEGLIASWTNKNAQIYFIVAKETSWGI